MTIQTATGSVPFEVELAITPPQKARGLMFRESMPEDHGMLFAYRKPLIPAFWMKNTLIPLDILFIGSDHRIKTISENMPPCPKEEVCPTYAPTEEVQYVLELNAGDVERKKIAVGDTVELALDLGKH